MPLSVPTTTADRPDVTRAQKASIFIAGVPIVANLLRAFGVYDLSKDEEQALQDTMGWGFALAGVLSFTDAAIRAARNHHDAKVTAAAYIAQGTTPPTPDLNDLADDTDLLDDVTLPGERPGTTGDPAAPPTMPQARVEVAPDPASVLPPPPVRPQA